MLPCTRSSRHVGGTSPQMPSKELAVAQPGGDTSPTTQWEQHPPSFYCPISQQCMHDPVVLADGHTYERRYIERWLEEHHTSPVSGLELRQKDLFPNHALRNAIEEYFQQVFSAHRRAIRRSLVGVEPQDSIGSDTPLMRTIDALMQCSLLMNAELSIGSVLKRIMDEAKQLLGAEAASVFLIDIAQQELYSKVNSTGGELRIPLSAGIAGHVATTGEPVVIHDAYNDDRFNKEVDVKTGFRTRNILCVPLKVKKGGVIGVVQLINKSEEGFVPVAGCREQPTECNNLGHSDLSFTADDLQFLQVFASQAATAVVNSGSFDQANNQVSESQTDSTEPSCCRPETPVKKRAPRSLLLSIEEEQEDELPMHASASSSSDAIERRPNATCINPYGGELLEDALSSWSLDTIRLDEATGGKPLSTLGMHMFVKLGLVQHFALPLQKLQRFFLEIEAGYSSVVPYHNKAHGASVMHAMYALLEHGGIASMVSPALSSEDACLEDTRMEILMTSLLAAAVHDFEHLGLSNDFLVKTSHPRALLYNDQHVNENHHAAAALSVLRRAECNFLEHLPVTQVRAIRKLMIELVLGTDMSSHGDLMQSFIESTGREHSSGFMPSSGKEATLLLKLALKCADLGHLSLPWQTHLQWVHRLEEEFFQQGDQERATGLPVSSLMDRAKPGASQTQPGFFQNVVHPLFTAMAQAVPNTASFWEGMKRNFDIWVSLDQRDDTGEGRTGATKQPPAGRVQSAPLSSLVGMDDEESLPALSARSAATSVSTRKRSGRSRQRAARWWAKVRCRTPSPP